MFDVKVDALAADDYPVLDDISKLEALKAAKGIRSRNNSHLVSPAEMQQSLGLCPLLWMR